MDLSDLDAASPAQEGREMTVLRPGTETPALDENGKPVTVTLLGRLSATAESANRRIAQQRLERARKGDGHLTLENMDADTTELLVACTSGWTFTTLDGKAFPCCPANARVLWTDPRFKPIREQASRFVADDSNFTRR